MTLLAATRSVLKGVLTGVGFLLLSAAAPAHACFINSWCSSSRSGEYGSSGCSSQRDSCDNRGGGSTSSAPSRSYGAIAYSVSSGAWGYSEEYASRNHAQSRAVKECRMKDCAIAAWFYNSCGALASSANGSWGGAQGIDEPRARQNAQARCAKEGGRNCQIVFSRCSR